MITTGYVPALVTKAEERAAAECFNLSCSRETGMLLRVLAASKPGGRILELGTGVGVGAAWLLDGMDSAARLVSIEVNEEAAKISREILFGEPRLDVLNVDACAWLESYDGPNFDLIFADVGILKYERRSLTLSRLAIGGFFIGDDLLPQPKWVAAHPARVEKFRAEIVADSRLAVILQDWGSGIAVASKIA